jgi:hypothetical protein
MRDHLKRLLRLEQVHTPPTIERLAIRSRAMGELLYVQALRGFPGTLDAPEARER